jgi:hypothetical protein
MFTSAEEHELKARSNVHDVFWTPFDENRWFLYILFDAYFNPVSHRIDFEGKSSRFASHLVHSTERYGVILCKRIEPPVLVRVSVSGTARARERRVG